MLASVDAAGNVVVGGIVFSPVEILETDEESYRLAYIDWRDNAWIPERQARLDSILADKSNVQRYRELEGAVSRDQVVPFVGSGMSAPCGLPLWADFLRELRTSSTVPEDQLEALLSAGRYEEAAAQLVAGTPTHLIDERIEHTLCGPVDERVSGAVCILPEIFSETIVTSNLDDVLELLYRNDSLAFEEVLSGSRIAQFRPYRGKGRRCLLKVHGTRETREGRVLTTTEYDAVYGAGSDAHTELTYVFGSEPLLFLGCSLAEDRTMQLLRDVVIADDNTPRNYTFLQRPADEAEKAARERFLAERKIFPIWYDGDHDEAIEALLFGLARGKGKI